ncbi:MAB_1171c family putative transporter [Streptomyces hygroscopicus]|uniref:MAB_1171c family putative transporter n=1 Tax=Streptomyces hygroscopicus TaxID=1912 RepID=UPI001F3EFC90|nr:MAB_1171c family putative transporter [Streptomyces hygroscopicus]
MVFPFCAAICLLVLLYKVRDIRIHRKDPALVALLVAFSCKGASFALSTPSVSAAVDARTGIPNLGALGIHLFGGVASSAAILIAIAYWVYPPDEACRKAFWRLVSSALCAAVMLTMWFVAGSAGGGRATHYLLQQAHRPPVTVYLLVYVTAFGSGMVEIIRLCWRFGRVAGRQWLRRGLYATGIGAAAYLVYCIDRASAVVAVQFGLNPLRWELLTPLANGIGISFLAVGLTMPSWGQATSEWHRKVRNFIHYQRLYALWRALTEAHPHVVLEPQHSATFARIMPGNIGYRLYREVIEIQDGLLALRPYMDPGIAARARQSARQTGLSGEALRAAVQATVLRQALWAKQAAPGMRRTGDGPPAVQPYASRSGDYGAEVAWLLSVARAFSNLPSSRRSSS